MDKFEVFVTEFEKKNGQAKSEYEGAMNKLVEYQTSKCKRNKIMGWKSEKFYFFLENLEPKSGQKNLNKQESVFYQVKFYKQLYTGNLTIS